MHACFHGGGGGGVKTINIIRDLTKNMKAMSLNARARRRRRRGRRSEEEEDPQTSAKITPAQMQEADGDHDPPTSSGSHQPRKEEQGGKRRVHCDKCYCPVDVGAVEEAPAAAADNTTAEESDGEWVAEPEPGVLMTLVSRADGTNQLRKLRFREELFEGPRAAQRWWADNYDFIVELYSLVQPDGSHEGDDADGDDDEPVTPCQSEDDSQKLRRWQRPGCDSASTSGPSSGSGGGSASTAGSPILGLVVAAPETSSRGRGPGPSQEDKCHFLHRS